MTMGFHPNPVFNGSILTGDTPMNFQDPHNSRHYHDRLGPQGAPLTPCSPTITITLFWPTNSGSTITHGAPTTLKQISVSQCFPITLWILHNFGAFLSCFHDQQSSPGHPRTTGAPSTPVAFLWASPSIGDPHGPQRSLCPQ